MTISCENRFCVYWEENECIFDDIEINALGGCTSCVLIELSEEEAEEKRNEMLERFKSYHK